MLTALRNSIGVSPAWRAGVVALACFAGAEFGHFVSLKTPDLPIATFWPPAGLLLATLVLSRYRLWPAMLLAASAATLASDVLLHDTSVPVSLGSCFAHGGEACLGAWLLRRLVGLPVTLARVKDVLGLTCLSALFSAVFGAAVGAGVVALAFDAPYWTAWQVWWRADATGVLIVAPVVLTWTAEHALSLKGVDRWRVAEGVALFVGLVVTAEGVYGELLPRPLRVPVFVLPFLLWAGVRSAPPVAAAALLVVTTIGIWNTSHGRGPYTALTPVPSEQVARVQATACVINICVLAMAATVAERRRAERQRLKLIGELEHALAELKTLRGLIPICGWCKKIRDDQGFWQRLEDYLRAHTDAQFTHGICPACLDKQFADMASGTPGREGGEGHDPAAEPDPPATGSPGTKGAL